MFETQQEASNAAIALLARRDHSRKELQGKLQSRCEQIDLDAVLDQLEQAGYLSDQRFTESFIRMRSGQGHGEIRIRFDLKQKGITQEMIALALEDSDTDWFSVAADLCQRKYRMASAKGDYRERAKRIRYLSQRGFTMDQVSYALEQLEMEPDD